MKPSPDLYVNLGLPSGNLWAKSNLDDTQANGFAASEFQYECSYVSWGNIEMHDPVSASAFEYDWGGINSQQPFYGGQPYGDTPGCDIQTNIGLSFDVARVLAGSPWRLPSSEDFNELFTYVDFIDAEGNIVDPSRSDKRVVVNGIMGVYLKSRINGERLFFPCSGVGQGTSLSSRGSGGAYWSLSYNSPGSARALYIYESGISFSGLIDRFKGCTIRPIWRDIR